MGKTMTGDAFVVYAREQINTAASILAKHRLTSHGCCTCGRATPCATAVEWSHRRDHYETRLIQHEAAIRNVTTDRTGKTPTALTPQAQAWAYEPTWPMLILGQAPLLTVRAATGR